MAEQLFGVDEVLELVMEDGSDNEEDLCLTGYDLDEENEEDNDDDSQANVVHVGDLEVQEDQDLDQSREEEEPGSDTEFDMDNISGVSDTDEEDVIPPTPPIASTSRSSPIASSSRSGSQSSSSPSSTTSPPLTDAYGQETDVDLDPEPEEEIEIEHLLLDDDDTWVRNLNNYPISPPFTGTPGFQVQMEADAAPIDFFRLFITDAIIKKIKSETNRYAATTCAAARRRNANLSRRSFFNMWKTVTEGDILKFLAIAIHMGLVQKPRINDYWSTNRVMTGTFPSTCLKRDRFKMILAFLHLNDNRNYIPAGRQGHDPLFKIRPLFDRLNLAFKNAYIPEENICIDEALCPRRGRVGFRVYIKNKPVKWGIKLYELCESSSGYVYDMEIYCRYPGLSNSPSDVVKRLLGQLGNQGRTLYLDNYYMCPKLAQDLLLENTNSVGTVRSNRIGMPHDLTQGAFVQGQMDYRRKGQLLCVRWKDKRDIHMLTTVHHPVMRRVRTRAEGEKQKPVCNIDYTANMCGVDHSDQMLAYAPLHRKTVKWWKKLAFHLLTLAMVQAHCLYNKHRRHHGKKTSQIIDFTISVCEALDDLSNTETNQNVGAAVDPNTTANRLTGRHFPESLGGASRRNCLVCFSKLIKQGTTVRERQNKRKTSHFQCKTCKVALCIDPCFEIYHTKKVFDE